MNQLYSISTFLLSILFLTLSSQSGQAQQKPVEKKAANTKKPNFVIILADDLGYGDLGCTGSTQIKTQAIDQLAKEGVFCTQAYVASPVCSPSRMGLLTGANPPAYGVVTNPDTRWPHIDPSYMGLPVEKQTIANHLKKMGYATGCIGKWHLGSLPNGNSLGTEPKFHPTNRGFDEFYGFLPGGHNYFQTNKVDKNYNCPIESNYSTPGHITYLTDDLATEGAGFITRHKKEPFFLFMSFNAPHSPLQPKQEDLDKLKFIPDSTDALKDRKKYCALVLGLDRAVKTIMDALKENGLDENTCVVFLSDNGGPTPYTYACNAPYAGMKGTNLEGGIRVPFIVRWPKELKAGQKYEAAVSALDILPTFLTAAGNTEILNEKGIDGINILPLLKGATLTKSRTLYWQFDNTDAVLDGNWKYILVPDRLPLLFNLKNDPSELHNCFKEEQERAAILARKLGRWLVTNPAPLFPEGKKWAKEHLHQYDLDFSRKQPAINEAPSWVDNWDNKVEDCPQ